MHCSRSNVRPEEIASRGLKPRNIFYFGSQKITTKVYMTAPAEREAIALDVVDSYGRRVMNWLRRDTSRGTACRQHARGCLVQFLVLSPRKHGNRRTQLGHKTQCLESETCGNREN